MIFIVLRFLKPQKNGNRVPSSVAVSCSKKRVWEEGGFVVRPSVRVPKTRILCQEQS